MADILKGIKHEALLADAHLTAADYCTNGLAFFLSKAIYSFPCDSADMQMVRQDYSQIYNQVKDLTEKMESEAKQDIILYDMLKAQNRGDINGEKV